MNVAVDDTRRGDPLPRGQRSPARQLMDAHVDTGTWIKTECATPELGEVRKRLYTLANKAGYSLRTESEEVTPPDGSEDGISVLRFQVRSQRRKGGPA